jgi:uncharacterized protein (TIGR03118 family)
MFKNLHNYFLSAICIVFVCIVFIIAGCHPTTSPTVVAPTQGFIVTPLAANKASYGVTTADVDTNLQDAWGLAFNTKFGYPWIANRASGTTSILNATDSAINHYDVNGSGGTKGSPTGIVQDTTGSFPVVATGTNATWIFSELDGVIAAVTSGGAQGNSTFVLADESANSSYTGLALVANSGGTRYLYAPNVRNGSLDQFSANYGRNQSSGQHSGYTPFNTVLIDTQLFVSSAKMATISGQPFVALGPYNGGYVDIYDVNGNFEKNLISGDSLDEPWGIAIAPASFGSFSGKLLVGNFGDGKIHVYDPKSGALLGSLNDANGNPIVIQGLWALVVYNSTLYYTAGPYGGTDGIFGKITLQ